MPNGKYCGGEKLVKTPTVHIIAQSLRDVKTFRALTVIRAHANSHAFVELDKNGQHRLWYAEACEHYPQQLSVDGVICRLEMDESHLQRDNPCSSNVLQSTHDKCL